MTTTPRGKPTRPRSVSWSDDRVARPSAPRRRPSRGACGLQGGGSGPAAPAKALIRSASAVSTKVCALWEKLPWMWPEGVRLSAAAEVPPPASHVGSHRLVSWRACAPKGHEPLSLKSSMSTSKTPRSERCCELRARRGALRDDRRTSCPRVGAALDSCGTAQRLAPGDNAQTGLAL